MKFSYPLKLKVITQDFNGRPEVYRQFGLKSHGAIDWRAKEGTEVYAMANGTVKEVGDQGNKGYGKFVRLQHQTCESVYAHFSQHKVKEGDEVKVGDCIGLSGNTGFSTAAHLHTGVRMTDKDGNVLDYGNGWKGYINFKPFIVDPNATPSPPVTATMDEARKEAILTKARQNRLNRVKLMFSKIVSLFK